MSITIIQAPAEVTPAYNPINYVVSSTNVAEPSFQYVFDLYIAGAFISRHRLPPKTFTGVARLDVSSIVQSYVTHNIDLADSAFDRNPNSWVDFYISFGEEYSVDGVLITYIDLLESDLCLAVNASLEYKDFAKWSTNTFFQGSVRKYLTNIDQPNIDVDTNLWLYLYHETPGNIVAIEVRTYTAAGTLINYNSFSPTDLSDLEIGDRFLRISVGTKNLKALFSSGFFDGASYYVIKMIDLDGTFAFEEKRINIQDSSCKYEPVTLHFLNTLGAFDVFTFKLASEKNSSIERKDYNVATGSFNESNEFIYSVSDRSSQIMASSNQDSITANSDWISEAESTWLKELVTSPVVFMEADDELTPIRITENRYKFNKKVNEKLFNRQITFELGNENFRQTY